MFKVRYVMLQGSIGIRRSLIVILCTILVHLLLLFVLLVPIRSFFINPVLEQKLDALHQKLNPTPPITQHTPWVTVHPMQGAPVIMSDDTDDAPSAAVAQDMTRDEPEEPQAQAHKDSADTPMAEPQIEDQSKEEMSTISDDHAVYHVRTAPRPDPNYIPATLFKPERRTQTDTKKRVAAHQDKKPRITLTKLVDGLASESTAGAKQIRSLSLSMIGTQSDTVKMTEQQLKEGRFLEKIAAALIAAWRAQMSNCPIQAPPRVDIHIQFIIQEDGSVKDVTILKTTGIPSLDGFVTNVIHSAGTGMPPVPSFLKPKQYPIRVLLDGLDPRRGPARLIAVQT